GPRDGLGGASRREHWCGAPLRPGLLALLLRAPGLSSRPLPTGRSDRRADPHAADLPRHDRRRHRRRHRGATEGAGLLPPMSLSVVYITEAGPVVGLGHLRRCQALATALRRRGAGARFRIDAATLGPEYSLVAPALASSPARVTAEIVGRVLLTLGGSATPSALATAVAAVRRAVPSATVDVALGLYADDLPDDGGLVIAHRGQRSLRELIRHADLAVTAGGMTLYECLATGTPAVGLCCADHQRLNIEALRRAGPGVSAEPSLRGAVRRVAADPEL